MAEVAQCDRLQSGRCRFDSDLALHRVAVTQLVECDLAKVDVAGSSPVSHSSTHDVRLEGQPQ